MDYVLFGMGYGATLMLLGWALRTFGPERKYKKIDSDDADAQVARRSWVRFVQGLGGVIAIAGSAFVLFTFIIVLVNPADRTGAIASVIVWGLLLVAVLIWCWMYVGRFGLTGLWNPGEGYGFRKSGSTTSTINPLGSRDTTSPVSTSTHSGGPQYPTTEVPGPAGLVIETDEPTVLATHLEADETDSVEQPEQSIDMESEMGPEYDFGDGADTTVPADVGGRAEAIRRLRERQSRSESPID